ncbi:hypothetical protein ROSINTL182_06249 [Roseburia intestinalis L1-82]|uniref:Uncharacterized protein n=1 Tax=Roseburia intestinalis L1-82 TaxID=536231 RepID=C7G8M3_9FIRM|nr:hypothetical protein ROSINTL182_06249 [Roseburia intestinalis L1-82]
MGKGVAVRLWWQTGVSATPFYSSLLYIGDTVGARKMTFRALFV